MTPSAYPATPFACSRVETPSPTATGSSVVSNLPEASKYNILYDPKSTDASTRPAMEKPENKAILDGLNKKLRQNQLDTINSAKNVEFKGVIKVLIEELPNIVLRHISAHVSEHITVQIQTANMHTHSATVGSIPIV
mgnify:CR=1 FL=1